MRKDLNKVVTERERSGPRGHDYDRTQFNRLNRFMDPSEREEEFAHLDLPKNESLRRPHRVLSNSREFSDNLGAIRGLLHKNVGRPWDKVYSEFCAVFNRDSVTGQHVHQHLLDAIVRNTYMKDGHVCHNKKFPGRQSEVDASERVDTPASRYDEKFYVHPTTGRIVERKDEARSKYKKEPPPGVRISDTIELHQLKGIWYRAHLRPATASELSYGNDMLGNGHVNGTYEKGRFVNGGFIKKPTLYTYLHLPYHKPNMWAYKKEQLNYKELRKYKLQNDLYQEAA